MTRSSEPGKPVQLGLFGALPSEDPPAKVAPAEVGEAVRALADRVPEGLSLGTSSWSFPGWRGLVYAPGAAQKHLARHGLAAYAKHPLLSAVGVDRTFYAPLSASDFAEYAAVVPERFRFLVKAWNELTSPAVYGRPGPNPRYLDPVSAIDHVLEPAIEGLGEKLGPLVFQFPPQGRSVTRHPEAFADRLHEFFAALPPGVSYAVELRDAALFTERYVEALASAGAAHCYCVHPRMPSLARQRELAPLAGPVAVRWMLHADLGYSEAKDRYQPFDRIVDADPGSRADVAALCIDALARDLPVVVTVNNKAEGCAPRSIAALVDAIVG